jgi:hypothetical protein
VTAAGQGSPRTSASPSSSPSRRTPLAGDIIKGTGGARKRRFPGRGKGKNGGYRTISYYAAEDVPVLLLALVDKGERTDITPAERNGLRDVLATYAPTYRAIAAGRAAAETLRRRT